MTLNNGGVLSLGSPPSFAGFGNVSLNGGATVDPTNSIITLTDGRGQSDAQCLHPIEVLGGRRLLRQLRLYGLGELGQRMALPSRCRTMRRPRSEEEAAGSVTPECVKSAALQLNIYTRRRPADRHQFRRNGTAGTYISSAPVNLASGNPIKVDVSLQQHCPHVHGDPEGSGHWAPPTRIRSTVPDLSSILGGNLAYVGFTGATGGAWAVQTVGSFVFNDFSQQQGRTLPNDITVSAGATGGLDVAPVGPGVGGAAALKGVLTLNAGSVLNVTGGATATDTPYFWTSPARPC